jgi:hypothetical protein
MVTVLAIVAAVLGVVSTLLHLRKPVSGWEFTVEQVVDEVLAYLGQHNPTTGTPADVAHPATIAQPATATATA